jgi:type VI secretion system protein ImpB
MKTNSQKYLGENRAPRVHIAYDVEVSGEQKSVELPFVMGVMADLSGHDSNALPSVVDRRFVDIEASSFDMRMQEISPSLHLKADNKLTGEGVLTADLQFRRIEDFRPDKVAKQIPALASLLDARQKLSALLSYMDGKAGAGELLKQILENKELLKQIAFEDAASKRLSSDNSEER